MCRNWRMYVHVYIPIIIITAILGTKRTINVKLLLL